MGGMYVVIAWVTQAFIIAPAVTYWSAMSVIMMAVLTR